MSHIFQLSDEQYTKLATYGAQQDQTPEILFQVWVNELIHTIEEPVSSSATKRVVQEKKNGYEGELLDSPLSQIFGIFSIDAPDLADRHDEYLAEAYMEDHAQKHQFCGHETFRHDPRSHYR